MILSIDIYLSLYLSEQKNLVLLQKCDTSLIP